MQNDRIFHKILGRSPSVLGIRSPAPNAHDKRAMGAIYSFPQANRSFAHKIRARTRKTIEQIPNPVLRTSETCPVDSTPVASSSV